MLPAPAAARAFPAPGLARPGAPPARGRRAWRWPPPCRRRPAAVPVLFPRPPPPAREALMAVTARGRPPAGGRLAGGNGGTGRGQTGRVPGLPWPWPGLRTGASGTGRRRGRCRSREGSRPVTGQRGRRPRGRATLRRDDRGRDPPAGDRGHRDQRGHPGPEPDRFQPCVDSRTHRRRLQADRMMTRSNHKTGRYRTFVTRLGTLSYSCRRGRPRAGQASARASRAC